MYRRKRMKRGLPAYGLALGLSVLLAEPALAQQDTTAARSEAIRRGFHRAMMHQRGLIPGLRRMGADHIDPGLLLGLKSELQLSDQQVEQLTRIRDDHHALVRELREDATALRERTATARDADDYGALERIIDERADQLARMAKSHLSVERQAIGVLSADQRQRVETWQEGAPLFRRGHWRQLRQMRPGQGAPPQGPPPGQ